MLLKIITHKATAFLILLVVTQTLFAQEGFITDSVEFCSQKIAVPDSCVAKTKHSVQGDGWYIEWSYGKNAAYPFTKGAYSSFSKQFGFAVTRENKKFIVLNKEVRGAIFKLMSSEGRESYTIYASAKINKQSVLVLLSLGSYPENNNSIPDFARKMVQFKQ